MKHKIQILFAIALVAIASAVVFASLKEKKNLCSNKNCENCGSTELYDITNFKTGTVYFIK